MYDTLFIFILHSRKRYLFIFLHIYYINIIINICEYNSYYLMCIKGTNLKTTVVSIRLWSFCVVSCSVFCTVYKFLSFSPHCFLIYYREITHLFCALLYSSLVYRNIAFSMPYCTLRGIDCVDHRQCSVLRPPGFKAQFYHFLAL